MTYIQVFKIWQQKFRFEFHKKRTNHFSADAWTGVYFVSLTNSKASEWGLDFICKKKQQQQIQLALLNSHFIYFFFLLSTFFCFLSEREKE